MRSRDLQPRAAIDGITEAKPPAYLILILIAFGALLIVTETTVARDRRAPVQYAATLGVLLTGFIPVVRRSLSRWIDHLREPSGRAKVLTQITLTALSAWYFLQTADHQARLLMPRQHDEQMYAIQARMVAGGHLWLPQHPLADFFETFYVFVRPVYAPMYFPGTAMLFAPAVWLGISLPVWAALIAGGIVGLSYRVCTSLFDGAMGLLAALMMLAHPVLHYASVMVMSHLANLFLALCFIWAWATWRRNQKWGWALLTGFAFGWMAITRPQDAVCTALPIGVMVVLKLRRQQWRPWLLAFGPVLLGAMPFLVTQGIFDHAVTGSFFHTPTTLYNETYWPATLHRIPPGRPAIPSTQSTAPV